MTTTRDHAEPPEPMIRRRLVVSGQVQGVWFRASTRQTAQRVGATGWVHNRQDGAVEAEVQGTREAVEAVTAFCSAGPPDATVARLASQDIPVVADERTFEVR